MPRGVYVRTSEHIAQSLKCLEKARLSWPNGLNPNTGKSMSEEQKKKISVSLKGRKVVHTPEHMANIAKALRGRVNPLVHGNKSPLWKHGKSATKEYIKNMKQRRYAFERGGGVLSTKTVQLVYEDNIKKYGTLTCIYCIAQIPFGKDTLEHKQPLSKGGTNVYENLGVACLTCNSRKRAMTYDEFIFFIGQGAPRI